ncbi:hypothetical protein LTR15_007316 [Elasticomyces elasticus]|nr:hypothetical protein LTR15_007316 [Elasticomyces elasticus]
MAPKATCNALKLASVLTYMQKSRVAHNLKDLEKHLPSLASINGMVVKDYLQALADENKINVEKIGSGNWYWSFVSQDKKTRQNSLDEAQSAHDKAAAVIRDLRGKLAEAQALRADEEEMLDDAGESRADLATKKNELEADTKKLQKELAAYSDSDPTELERKRKEVDAFKKEADQCADEIYMMEGWFKERGVDAEGMQRLQESVYGDQYSADDGGLRELV